MTQAESPGSDRGELKKLLKLAADKPIHMAIALGKDGKAIVKLDKLKPPRTLEKALKDGAEGSKNHRFGTVMIDPDEPKVVRFIVNKEIGGFARKLVVALKGSGFRKVKLVTEDGSPLEDAAGEDEEDDTEDEEDDIEDEEDDIEDETAHRAGMNGTEDGREPASGQEPRDEMQASQSLSPENAAAGDTAGHQPHAVPEAPADANRMPDPKALASELTALVRKVLEVISQDPSRRGELATVATQAQAALKAGDLAKAADAIETLRQTVDERAEIRTEGTGTPPAPELASAPGAPDKAVVQKLQKSRMAWDATLAKLTSDMDQLVKAVNKASEGHALAETFERDFQAAVKPLFDSLDSSLSDLLHKASQAKDQEEQERVLRESRAKLAEFTKLAKSHPVIDHLDGNPFVPIAVGKTLTTTLAAIATIIH